jgi:hypothetical protein
MKKLLLLLLLSFSLIGSAYASSHFHDWPDDSICLWVKQRPTNEGYLNEARKRGLDCNGIVYGTSSAQNNPSQEPENNSKSNDDGLPNCSGFYWNNCVGEKTVAKGIVYVGEFKKGKLVKGNITSPDGTNFDVECKYVSYTYGCYGKGTIVAPDGTGKYVGFIRNNMAFGQGKYTYSDGSTQEGIWKDDKFVKKIVLPENAHVSGNSWKCNTGYIKIRYEKNCAKIPDNASASGESSWKCNSGYFKNGKSCAKIPDNASASGESSWKCNSPLEKSGNFCITIPLNASASGNGGWECNSGSKKIGDICKIQQVKNLHFHSGTKSIDELDFSSTNFCDLSPKVQLRNNNFYLPNQEDPYAGKNLCIYLLNGQYYNSGEIKKGLRQGKWTYWHQNGQKMAEGLYLDGVPAGQWNFWDENGSQKSENIQISVSEIKVNTAKTGNDVASTDKIDYQSEKHLGKLAYCAGMMSTINPDMGEAGKQIYIIVFEELFPDSDIKNIVKKGFDLGKQEYAALEFAADFDQVMSNAEERARVSENCSRLSAQFLESMEGVGGYRP